MNFKGKNNMDRKIYNSIFILLIIVQLLLLKCYITLNGDLFGDAYLITFIVTVFFIMFIYKREHRSRKKIFFHSAVTTLLLIYSLQIKSSYIPAATLVEKNIDSEYYILFQERNSPDYIRFTCDKLTYDSMNVSDNYINIKYTVAPITKKLYFKSFETIEN